MWSMNESTWSHKAQPSGRSVLQLDPGPYQKRGDAGISVVGDAANLIKGLKKQRASKLNKYRKSVIVLPTKSYRRTRQIPICSHLLDQNQGGPRGKFDSCDCRHPNQRGAWSRPVKHWPANLIFAVLPLSD
jgi:hypothetical protein